jgi:hypothetical protein
MSTTPRPQLSNSSASLSDAGFAQSPLNMCYLTKVRLTLSETSM